MRSCDVLIVGGGPAGSSCAAALVQAGADVALVDRSAFPRDKVCAGWITPAVVEALGLDLEEYAHRHTLQPFTGFRTGLMGGQTHDTHFDSTVSYGIRRCEFDAYLLHRSGVRVLPPASVREIRAVSQGWVLNGEIHAQMIVGAAGHFCPVAKAINEGRRPDRAVLAQEAEVELETADGTGCQVPAELPELRFWRDLSGYAWRVRKGRHLNVGVGRLAPGSLPDAVAEFRSVLERQGEPAPHPSRWKGHAYLLSVTSRRRIVAPGALLIGDAAGLALAPSGEGILTAVESGIIAASAIVHAAGDYSVDRLQSYADHLDRRFGSRTGRVPGFPVWLSRITSAVVLGVPWLRRHLLLERGFLHKGRAGVSVPERV